MKLIIDVPYEMYDCIKKDTESEMYIIDVIKHGIPYEERPQGEWIPVSERLPEQANQSYLVTVDYGKGIVCSCQRFFFGEDIGWNDDCVIAWQELPKPYKEGGKEE